MDLSILVAIVGRSLEIDFQAQGFLSDSLGIPTDKESSRNPGKLVEFVTSVTRYSSDPHSPFSVAVAIILHGFLRLCQESSLWR